MKARLLDLVIAVFVVCLLALGALMPAHAQAGAVPFFGAELGKGKPFISRQPEGWIVGWYTAEGSGTRAQGRLCVSAQCPTVTDLASKLGLLMSAADPNALMAQWLGEAPEFSCENQPADLAPRSVLCRRLVQRLIENGGEGFIVAAATRVDGTRPAYSYGGGNDLATAKKAEKVGATAGATCFGPAWELTSAGRWMQFDPLRPDVAALCVKR